MNTALMETKSRANAAAAMEEQYSHAKILGVWALAAIPMGILSWIVGRMNQHPAVSHGVGIDGSVTEIRRYLDDDVTIILLSNRQTTNVPQIALQTFPAIKGTRYACKTLVALVFLAVK